MKPGTNSVQPQVVVTPTMTNPSPAPPRIRSTTSLIDGGGGIDPMRPLSRAMAVWPAFWPLGQSSSCQWVCTERPRRTSRRVVRATPCRRTTPTAALAAPTAATSGRSLVLTGTASRTNSSQRIAPRGTAHHRPITAPMSHIVGVTQSEYHTAAVPFDRCDTLDRRAH